MLTEEEIDSLRIAREELAELGFKAVPRMLESMQGRLTSPRAVLDEAERLLRERGVADVWFAADIATLRTWPGDDGDDPLLTSKDTLADAYEALKEGE